MRRLHPFEQYYRKHGHYPRVRIDNGAYRLTVAFHPGYVHIYRAGAPHSGVYITRSAFFTLLRKSLPLARLWTKHPAKDFDVESATHEALAFERALSRELREQKQATADQRAAARKHKRYLSAKARSNRQ